MELGGRALTITQTEHCCAHSVQFFFKFVQFCFFVFHFVQLYFWYFPRDISCSLIRLQQPTDVSWSNIFLPARTVWQPKRAEDFIFLFWPIYSLFGQIHFEIKTNTIWNWDKYILKFRQIQLVQYLLARHNRLTAKKGRRFNFPVWTNTFSIWTNTFWN